MQIVLITCPTVTEYDDPKTIRRLYKDQNGIYTSPPLGTLVVAALFERLNWSVTVVDANSEYCSHLDRRGAQSTFCRRFAEDLARLEADHFGFSTICSSYPFTLRIAQHLKRLKPDCTILLGGPQASATANETVRLCTFVDFILCGEVENSISLFAKHAKSAPHLVPGLVWRDACQVLSNPLPKPTDVTAVPLPAYNLWNMATVSVVHVEAGRGCPYRCKFCSTCGFFGRAYRLKPAKSLLDDVAHIVDAFGIRRISFVHDTLFCRWRDCEKFCLAWESDPRLIDVTWTCSLRADSLSPRLGEILCKANCKGVFLGIESGSPRIQRIIGKRIPLSTAKCIQGLNDRNVHVATSFILGFPEERESDLRQTMAFYLRMLRFPNVKPQASVLAVLAGSGYDGASHGPLVFRDAISSMAHQGPPIPGDLVRVIRSWPQLFSSHHLPALRHLERDFITESEHFLKYGTMYRWLLVLLADCLDRDLLAVLKAWHLYPKRRSAGESLYHYYASRAFSSDLDAFVRHLPGTKRFSRTCLPQYQFLCDVYGHKRYKYREFASLVDTAKHLNIDGDSRIARNCDYRQVEYSFRQIVEALATGADVGGVGKTPSGVLLYRSADLLVVEEPSQLTAIIVSLLKKEKTVHGLVDELAHKAVSALPQQLQVHPHAAFFHAVKELLFSGVLRLNDARRNGRSRKRILSSRTRRKGTSYAGRGN